MSRPDENQQELDLTGTDLAHLGAARHWVADRLDALGEAHREDTVLVVSELLDNAYQHAGGATRLRLLRQCDPCETTVVVTDSGAGSPRMRVPDLDGGRGLLLVDRLSRDWGVDRSDDGKSVWARLGCATADLPCPTGQRRATDRRTSPGEPPR